MTFIICEWLVMCSLAKKDTKYLYKCCHFFQFCYNACEVVICMKKRLRITDIETNVIEYDVELIKVSDSKYELHYEESDRSLVKVKVGKESLCLNRVSEGIETVLFFKEDSRIDGKAITVYGNVPIRTYTTHLDMNEDYIKLNYTVEGNEDTEFSYHWEILEA